MCICEPFDAKIGPVIYAKDRQYESVAVIPDPLDYFARAREPFQEHQPSPINPNYDNVDSFGNIFNPDAFLRLRSDKLRSEVSNEGNDDGQICHNLRIDKRKCAKNKLQKPGISNFQRIAATKVGVYRKRINYSDITDVNKSLQRSFNSCQPFQKRCYSEDDTCMASLCRRLELQHISNLDPCRWSNSIQEFPPSWQTSSKLPISHCVSHSMVESSGNQYSTANEPTTDTQMDGRNGENSASKKYHHKQPPQINATNNNSDAQQSARAYLSKHRKFAFDFPASRHETRRRCRPDRHENVVGVRHVTKLIDKFSRHPHNFDKRTIDGVLRKKFKLRRAINARESELRHLFDGENVDAIGDSIHFDGDPFGESSSAKGRRCSCCYSCNWRRNFNGYFAKVSDTLGLGRRARSLESLSRGPNMQCCFSNAEKKSHQSSHNGQDIPPESNRPLTETQSLLKRLDSVLSDLVEREKRKIDLYHCNKKLLCNKSGKKSKDGKHHAPLIAEPTSSKDVLEANSVYIDSHPTPVDVLKKHEKWFTELKPYRFSAESGSHSSKLCCPRCYRHYLKKISKKQDTRSSNDDTGISTAVDSQRSSVQFTARLSDLSADSFIHDSSEKTASRLLSAKASSRHRSLNTSPNRSPSHKQSTSMTEFDSSADFSVDSAYVGSRQTTPDSAKKTQRASSTGYKTREDSSCNHGGSCDSTDIGREVDLARQSILSRIRDTKSYSDTDILAILNDFKQKWTHLSEKENATVVGTIKRDLGLLPTPLECASIILFSDAISSETRRGGVASQSWKHAVIPSVKECLEYLSKSMSMSSIAKGSNTVNSHPSRPSSSIAIRGAENAPFFGATEASSALQRYTAVVVNPASITTDDGSVLDTSCHVDSICDHQSSAASNGPHFASDLLWAQEALGDETCSELLAGTEGFSCCTPKPIPYNWEKLSGEVCTQFGISLSSP